MALEGIGTGTILPPVPSATSKWITCVAAPHPWKCPWMMTVGQNCSLLLVKPISWQVLRTANRWLRATSIYEFTT